MLYTKLTAPHPFQDTSLSIETPQEFLLVGNVWMFGDEQADGMDARGCGRTLRQAGSRNCRVSRKQTTEPIRNEILKGFPPSEALGNVI